MSHPLFFLATLLCLNSSVSAFRPVGHVLLKDEIVRALPDGNIFKEAMKRHPQIASWGAIAPDLGYNPDLSRTFRAKWKRQIKNSMQLADIAHYHAVGTFLTNLINEAYRRNDDKFFAFIGGWMTHIAGDFGSHNIYVKPEAGYYVAYEGGRDLHSELEKMSDAYLYSVYARNYCLSARDFKSDYYWKDFFGVRTKPKNRKERQENQSALDTMLGGCVETYFTDVYKKTYGLDSTASVSFDLVKLASTYYRSVGDGIGKYAGFSPYSVEESLDFVALKNRKALIDSAFTVGKNYGLSFIQKATGNDRMFSDSWNLDIGEHGEPTYVIRIDAGRKMTSRTKNDLYVKFANNQKESTEIKITTKAGPLKFAFYQKDSYFYAINLGGAMGEIVDCWKKENVKSATILMRPRKFQLFSNTFRIKRVTIYYNGNPIAFTREGDKLIKLKKKQTDRTDVVDHFFLPPDLLSFFTFLYVEPNRTAP